MAAFRNAFALLFLATAGWGADAGGAWSGVVDLDDPEGGSKIATPVRAVLAQKGATVTGGIGREEDGDLQPIRNGRLEGGRLTFEVATAETKIPVQFTLTLDGDKLEGTMKGELDSGPVSGAVRLKRGTAK